ncbi:HNH endonuclease signature motif containing protein [Psychrobacillus sp.]|uniref:HNH endonuclease n=1 Tax=Psychrobacillus sp. TaxID=1871623 RepID=UPI0028BECDFA|nr:HNH endonuclease signature motif containing protein [Psychrobacillus sp.]
MSYGFHPYSKEDQLKVTEKPKVNKKRYPERKKKKAQPNKPELYKGRVIPKRSKRGRITSKEYAEAQRQHGEHCFVCGTTQGLEAHHVRFRSNGGRGNWRNIRFLCSEHHRGNHSPHKNEDVRKGLEILHEDLYGEWFWSDKYDLFVADLIPNTTDEAFEEFMQKESERLAGS